MTNRIKYINMEGIFEGLCDLGMEEKQAEKLCVGVEKLSEFNNLFFFVNKERYEYFYQASDELKVKEYLGRHMDVNKLPDYKFKDFGNELLENCDSMNEFSMGNVSINEGDFYTALTEETLECDEYIEQLVNAKDFYEELKKVKKSNLEYLFDMAIVRAREELKEFEFED